MKLALTEKQFQRQVLDLAKLYGWRTAHFRPAMNARGDWRTAVAGDGAGFPDLVLVKDRLIFAELKTDVGKVGPEQRAWLDAVNAAGGTAVVWRPKDWREIERELMS